MWVRLIILLIVSMSVISAQETDSPFTLHDDEPVVAHGSFQDWDGRYTDPGAVFYHDGLFHMFRNGFLNWPASVQIGYLTSEDGLTWTEVSEEPVLYTDEVPFAEVAALASSALVEEDGTWVIYFYSWNQGQPATGAIGRATASDPLGPWTVDETPILESGGEGEWDSIRVDAPSVVRTEEGYRMYYTGLSDDYFAIGLATSEDGITWTKYDDPATTEAPFAESDPIFISTDANYNYHQPRVERVDDHYVMIFRLVPIPTELRGQMGLGIATSADGMQWEVVTPEPFWGRNTIPATNGFWFTASAYHDDTLYLYIEGGRGSNTDIYVATSTEQFPPQ